MNCISAKIATGFANYFAILNATIVNTVIREKTKNASEISFSEAF